MSTNTFIQTQVIKQITTNNFSYIKTQDKKLNLLFYWSGWWKCNLSSTSPVKPCVAWAISYV